jgi:hypothetical protein
MKKFLISIIVLSLIGCVSTGPTKFYSGPDKPASELSGIKCGAFIIVKAIDEKPVNNRKQFCDIAVLPGMHTITYQYYSPMPRSSDYAINLIPHKVRFYTRKGHSYMLAASYPDGQVQFWLFESDSQGKSTNNKVKYTVIK